MTGLLTLALAALLGLVYPAPSSAVGTATVTISTAAPTVVSGGTVTFTLALSCGVTGGCAGTTITIPLTSYTDLTGASVTNTAAFGNLSCASWTKSASSTQVTYTYGGGSPTGTLPTGAVQCTLVYTTTNLTTPNGETFTLTPTISGTNFTSSPGNSAVLTVTAAHNLTFAKTAPAKVGQGGQFVYDLHFDCGLNGSIGTSNFALTDPLPANFTYQSVKTIYNANNGNFVVATFPGTLTVDPTTQVLSYSDPGGTICNGASSYPGRDIDVTGTASTAGTPDAINATITNTATASWTYLDGTTGGNPSTAVSTVAAAVPDPYLSKYGQGQTLLNFGQYPWPPNNGYYAYTFPGNWNGTGRSVQWPITMVTSGTQSGANFQTEDPLPARRTTPAPGPLSTRTTAPTHPARDAATRRSSPPSL